jgi:hypothetical protein
MGKDFVSRSGGFKARAQASVVPAPAKSAGAGHPFHIFCQRSKGWATRSGTVGCCPKEIPLNKLASARVEVNATKQSRRERRDISRTSKKDSTTRSPEPDGFTLPSRTQSAHCALFNLWGRPARAAFTSAHRSREMLAIMGRVSERLKKKFE